MAVTVGVAVWLLVHYQGVEAVAHPVFLPADTRKNPIPGLPLDL